MDRPRDGRGGRVGWDLHRQADGRGHMVAGLAERPRADRLMPGRQPLDFGHHVVEAGEGQLTPSGHVVRPCRPSSITTPRNRSSIRARCAAGGRGQVGVRMLSAAGNRLQVGFEGGPDQIEGGESQGPIDRLDLGDRIALQCPVADLAGPAGRDQAASIEYLLIVYNNNVYEFLSTSLGPPTGTGNTGR